MSITPWVKASKSGTNGGSCVEVRRSGDKVEVRDTKDRGAGPVLRFTVPEFDAFLDGCRRGEFTHLLTA